jgi:hypothetical protein
MIRMKQSGLKANTQLESEELCLSYGLHKHGMIFTNTIARQSLMHSVMWGYLFLQMVLKMIK